MLSLSVFKSEASGEAFSVIRLNLETIAEIRVEGDARNIFEAAPHGQTSERVQRPSVRGVRDWRMALARWQE